MAVVGMGIDAIEIDRIQSVITQFPKFAERVLSPREIERWESLSERRKVEFLAGRWAAKEAFAKALGTGIGRQCHFQAITILPDELGKPVAVESPFDGKVLVSMTHTRELALATVLLEQVERK